jgi:hypothetical protein
MPDDRKAYLHARRGCGVHASRELVVGVSTFAAFTAGAIALGQQSPSLTVRAVSILAGLAGGTAVGIFAALAVHLARGPAAYAPIEGADSAWGVAEYEDAGDSPPR